MMQKKIIEETIGKEDVHKNVSEANASITENLETEDKKEKEVLEEAEKHQKFLSKFAEHYLVPCETKNYSGEWKFDDGTKITIDHNDANITGIWTKDGKKKKFTGNLKNCAAKITNHRMFYTRSLTTPNNEIDYIEDGQGFIFIENKETEIIKMMSFIEGKNKFSTLTRVV